jgi:signal transduction histidine kinase/CheY-like chemotaxis protein
VKGRTLERFYTDEDRRDRKPEHALKIAASEGRFEEEGWRVRKGGEKFWADVVLTPVLAEDTQLLGFAEITRDTSERRKLEEQLRHSQKMDAVGQLAAGVAHDFNNLLTIITGYGELVLEALKPESAEYSMVSQIIRAGERASALTRQLLIFSRRQVVEPKVLDLNVIVGDAQRMLGRLIGEDVQLACSLDPDLARVKVDPGQVEQIILNLCVNARDAMPCGGKLTIETRNVELDANYTHSHPEVRPGRYALLAVSDTGTGIDEKIRSHIFEPFFTTKGSGRGTGLGLATVFGIVNQNGGHIGLYTEVNRGTSFKIYLPQVGVSEEAGTALAPSYTSPKGDETLLLVEDEDAVRELSCHALRALGYTVLDTRGGEEALELCRRHGRPVQLVISDVVMPGMGGRQLVEQLEKLLPGIKSLFVSGYTDDAIVRHGVLQAETAFLQKPFTPMALAQKVRAVLDT